MKNKSKYDIAQEALSGIEGPLSIANYLAHTVNLLAKAARDEPDDRVRAHSLHGLVDMTQSLVENVGEALAEWDASSELINKHVAKEACQAMEVSNDG